MADPSHPPNGHRFSRLGIGALIAVIAMLLASALGLAAMDKDNLAYEIIQILRAVGGA